MNAVTDVSVIEAAKPIAVQHQGATLLAIIDRAATDPGFSVEKLMALLDVKERWDANEARRLYNEAFAAFKAETVRVVRNITIKDGPLKGKKHADLFSITDACTEALSKHGLSASYRVLEDAKDWIRIACVIKHAAGHSEETSFSGPVDNGPGRNAIQARKSSVTYLERVTLLLALGLAEQDADDDGAGGGDPLPAEPERPPYPPDEFEKNLAAWVKAIKEGALTPYKIIAKLETKGTLTKKQKDILRAAAPAADAAAPANH